MTTIIASRELKVSDQRRDLLTLPLELDPKAASLTVRIPRPTKASPLAWDEGGQVAISIVLDIDGEEHRCTGLVSGGARTLERDGVTVERDAYALSWALPWGFFHGDEPNGASAKRIGETTKAPIRAWVEIQRVKGACDTSFAVECEVADAPDIQRHHSIAVENATSAFEDGGDGDISVSFTANSGSNRVALVVGGTDRSGAVSAHTATYGGAGTTITRPWNVTDGSYSRCTGDIFKDSEIGSGAKTVRIQAAEVPDGGTGVAVLCLSGVDQTTPAGTAQTTSNFSSGEHTASVTVGSVGGTDLVVDGLYAFDTAITIGADQTQRTAAVTSNQGIWISTQPGSAGGVMSWTNVGNEFSYGAVAFKEASVSGMTGTIAATMQKATASLAGSHEQTGTIAATLQRLTAALSGAMQPSGTIAATMQPATSALAGSHGQTGTIAAQLQALVADFQGKEGPTGTIGATMQPATASLSGAMQPSGTIAAAMQPATAALSEGANASGAVAATMQKATASFAGEQSQTGQLAATLQLLTAVLLGSQTITGTITATMQPARAALLDTIADVLGFVAIRDEPTAYALLHDEPVGTARVFDEPVGNAEVRD